MARCPECASCLIINNILKVPNIYHRAKIFYCDFCRVYWLYDYDAGVFKKFYVEKEEN